MHDGHHLRGIVAGRFESRGAGRIEHRDEAGDLEHRQRHVDHAAFRRDRQNNFAGFVADGRDAGRFGHVGAVSIVGFDTHTIERVGERQGGVPRLGSFFNPFVGALSMSESGVAAAEKSNPGLAEDLRRFGRSLPLGPAIARLCRLLWPVKTDAEFALRTGLSQRTARDILAERAGLSGEALAALLRSADGFVVLETLMGTATPPWWRRFKRQTQLAEVRQLQDAARRRLEALEREEI